jgi:hypothetical protein
MKRRTDADDFGVPPLTEETCECEIDWGSEGNLFGQVVCAHCGKEKKEASE